MKLKWDNTGERLYETGVSKGVLFPQDSNGTYTTGVAWNGLTAVNESPSGAEATALYADNKKYLNLRSTEDYKATIEAYTYPAEFEACDGSKEIAPGITIGQQSRTAFGLSYQTLIGNDTDGTKHGYKIHLVYGATANPSDKGYESVNDSPDAITLSWEIETTPVEVDGFEPTASLIIDSTKMTTANMTAIENILYGTEENEPRLPLPSEIIELINTAA